VHRSPYFDDYNNDEYDVSKIDKPQPAFTKKQKVDNTPKEIDNYHRFRRLEGNESNFDVYRH